MRSELLASFDRLNIYWICMAGCEKGGSGRLEGRVQRLGSGLLFNGTLAEKMQDVLGALGVSW